MEVKTINKKYKKIVLSNHELEQLGVSLREYIDALAWTNSVLSKKSKQETRENLRQSYTRTIGWNRSEMQWLKLFSDKILLSTGYFTSEDDIPPTFFFDEGLTPEERYAPDPCLDELEEAHKGEWKL